jgi:hypothetical protein
MLCRKNFAESAFCCGAYKASFSGPIGNLALRMWRRIILFAKKRPDYPLEDIAKQNYLPYLEVKGPNDLGLTA